MSSFQFLLGDGSGNNYLYQYLWQQQCVLEIGVISCCCRPSKVWFSIEYLPRNTKNMMTRHIFTSHVPQGGQTSSWENLVIFFQATSFAINADQEKEVFKWSSSSFAVSSWIDFQRSAPLLLNPLKEPIRRKLCSLVLGLGSVNYDMLYCCKLSHKKTWGGLCFFSAVVRQFFVKYPVICDRFLDDTDT